MLAKFHQMALTRALVLPGSAPAFAGAALELANEGKSSYTIVHAEDASASVKLAARELQRVLKIATGAELPTVTRRAKGPAILVEALDDKPDPAAYDEYTIACVGRDIVIRGRHQETPGKGKHWFVPSQGTLYGVFDLLKRFVGVRWLLPGDVGEDKVKPSRCGPGVFAPRCSPCSRSMPRVAPTC